MRAEETENGWAMRNRASERERVSVCVLRGSSEDTESLQAHLNKRACEAELTTDNSEERERERRRIIISRREGLKTDSHPSTGKRRHHSGTVASVPCSSTEEHCLVSCMCLCLPTSISHSPTVFRRFCPLHSPAMIPWVLLLLWLSGHGKFSKSSCLFITSCVPVIAV